MGDNRSIQLYETTLVFKGSFTSFIYLLLNYKVYNDATADLVCLYIKLRKLEIKEHSHIYCNLSLFFSYSSSRNTKYISRFFNSMQFI